MGFGEKRFSMSGSHHQARVSRRTTLTGLGMGGLGLALANMGQSGSAHEPTHHIVGAWMVLNTPPNIGMLFSDGTMLNLSVSNTVGPDGSVGFASPGAGTWEALD